MAQGIERTPRLAPHARAGRGAAGPAGMVNPADAGKGPVSPFARRVYEVVSEVPAGQVTTYQKVAKRLGCKSARAVGQALKVNPYAPKVPCHRVIAADLTPGGFQGCRGGVMVLRKVALLAKEGVRFVDGRLEDPGRMMKE